MCWAKEVGDERGSGVIHSDLNGVGHRADALLSDLAGAGDARHQAVLSAVRVPPAEKRGTLRLIAGPDRTRSLRLRSSNRTRACMRRPRQRRNHHLPHHAGTSRVGPGCRRGDRGQRHRAQGGRGLAVSDEAALTLRGAGTSGGELLLFDSPEPGSTWPTSTRSSCSIRAMGPRRASHSRQGSARFRPTPNPSSPRRGSSRSDDHRGRSVVEGQPRSDEPGLCRPAPCRSGLG